MRQYRLADHGVAKPYISGAQGQRCLLPGAHHGRLCIEPTLASATRRSTIIAAVTYHRSLSPRVQPPTSHPRNPHFLKQSSMILDASRHSSSRMRGAKTWMWQGAPAAMAGSSKDRPLSATTRAQKDRECAAKLTVWAVLAGGYRDGVRVEIRTGFLIGDHAGGVLGILVSAGWSVAGARRGVGA